jgi:hypothetical protein
VRRSVWNIELKICADLANRSKRLTLNEKSKKVDADIPKRDINIRAGIAVYDSSTGEQKSVGGYGEYEFKIVIDDGREFDVIQTAEKAVNEWRRLLKRYGMFQR